MIGSAATLADRSSQPALGWIARQSSSQPETIDPGSSCARNLTGTAIRPLSSTVCRYSPVNTVGSTPWYICVASAVRGTGFPTSHHFVPLRCILGAESRQVKKESVLPGSDAVEGAAAAGRRRRRGRLRAIAVVPRTRLDGRSAMEPQSYPLDTMRAAGHPTRSTNGRDAIDARSGCGGSVTALYRPPGKTGSHIWARLRTAADTPRAARL